MLLAEEEELKQRRADIMQDKTLEMRLDLYRNFAKKYNISVIDAGLPIDSVHKEILKNIGY
jgi:thymidylate kinase